MKIKRMTATFGCLNHQTLELEEGLNLLTLPNEGGKSTWCAFLRVMLYGLNTRERDKKGFLADKSRYLPWSGEPMEGELLCTWQGRDLLIRRFTKGAAPMGVFEAVYADTGEVVPGLTGDNLGDVLIGASRSVFERSAFLGQSGLAVTQTPELEKQLAALVSSGEEGVSATQTREKLTEWQRRRQYRTRGTIPALEERRRELAAAQDSLRDLTSQIRESRTGVDQYEEMLAKLQHQIALHRAKREDEQAQAYAQAREELDQAVAQLEKLQSQLPQEGKLPSREELEGARDEVAYLRTLDANLKLAAKQVPESENALAAARAAAEDPVFSGTAADARSKAQEAEKQLEALERKRKLSGRFTWLWPAFFGILAVMLFAGFFVKLGGLEPLPSLISLAVLAVGIVAGGVFAGMKKRRARESAALLERFHAASAAELAPAAEDYCRRLDVVSRAEEELERVRRAERELQEQRTQTWNQLHDLVATFAPEVKDVFGFSAAIAKGLTLLSALSAAGERRESAEKLFQTVAAHGEGCLSDLPEEPSVTLEQAEAGAQEAQRRIAAYQADLSMALGRSSAMGDPDVIQAEIESLDRTLAKERADYDALSIALEALEQADAEMRDRFSPALNRIAGAYFNRLTQGKYAKVRLNRELDAGAEETGSVALRDVLALSQGTADQLWLSVRLAVCELALPGEEPCPLVLDDALASFDDDRAKVALELLEELSVRRQIILFSCQSRERRLHYGLSGDPAPGNGGKSDG